MARVYGPLMCADPEFPTGASRTGGPTAATGFVFSR
jgi:hypothetical protein